MSPTHILSITERHAYLWDVHSTSEVRKVYQLKGLPDCSAPMTANSVILSSFEQSNPGSTLYHSEIGNPNQATPVLYCLAGHKISAGIIPLNLDRDRINLANSSKEVSHFPPLSSHMLR